MPKQITGEYHASPGAGRVAPAYWFWFHRRRLWRTVLNAERHGQCFNICQAVEPTLAGLARPYVGFLACTVSMARRDVEEFCYLLV